MGSVSALSAGVQTTTLSAILDIVKRGERGAPPVQAWADFTLMLECTSDSAIGALCTLWYNLSVIPRKEYTL
jgi:hypothetical protein